MDTRNDTSIDADIQSHIKALRTQDWMTRSRAAWALGQIGDARAVLPLCEALQDEDGGVRYNAALALEKIGDAVNLPLRILSSSTLTPAQMIDTLHALISVRLHIGGYKVRYMIGDVEDFCKNLCESRKTGTEVTRGAQAVLAEIERRASARVLLRPSQRDTSRESEELLRGAAGQCDTTAPEELLRASDLSTDPAPPEKPGRWARMFKKK